MRLTRPVLLISFAFVAACSVEQPKTQSAAAVAQVSLDNAYQVRYATMNADSTIRVANTGARGGIPAGGVGPGGEICANLYGFTANGQMAGCCSCLVPPNGLGTLSTRTDCSGARFRAW